MKQMKRLCLIGLLASICLTDARQHPPREVENAQRTIGQATRALHSIGSEIWNATQRESCPVHFSRLQPASAGLEDLNSYFSLEYKRKPHKKLFPLGTGTILHFADNAHRFHCCFAWLLCARLPVKLVNGGCKSQDVSSHVSASQRISCVIA